MITFDEAELIIDDIVSEFPDGLFRELNGGVILSPDAKAHPLGGGAGGGMYIMGEYHNDRQGYGGLGRYIIIYFGSFARLYPDLSESRLRERMRDTLAHEFTHHLESLAGERDLEIKDRRDIEMYMKTSRRRRTRP